MQWIDRMADPVEDVAFASHLRVTCWCGVHEVDIPIANVGEGTVHSLIPYFDALHFGVPDPNPEAA